MPIKVRPATDFDDVAPMAGPKRPGANVCWCPSYQSRRASRCGVACVRAGMLQSIVERAEDTMHHVVAQRPARSST
jgi:hypothetical protein